MLAADLYLDGSCSRHVVPELQCAGWGIIQLDQEGEVAARVFGPLRRSLPQTPQVAGLCAYAAPVELAGDSVVLQVDCSNVICSAYCQIAHPPNHYLSLLPLATYCFLMLRNVS